MPKERGILAMPDDESTMQPHGRRDSEYLAEASTRDFFYVTLERPEGPDQD